MTLTLTLTLPTYPPWSASTSEPGARLSGKTVRAMIHAIAAAPARSSFIVLPGPVLGNSQRARRHRTVRTPTGARLELPNGSNPYVYWFTNGASWR